MSRTDQRYTIGEAEEVLGVTSKTLRRWIAKVGMSRESDETDGRVRRLSREQLKQLATAHHRTLATDGAAAPATGRVAPSSSPSQQALLARIAELERELQTRPTREDFVALQDQVASLLHTGSVRHAANALPNALDGATPATATDHTTPRPMPSVVPPAKPLPIGPRKAPRTRPLHASERLQPYAHMADEHLLDAILEDAFKATFQQRDAAEARQGRLRFQVWGHLCRVEAQTIESHLKVQRDGKMPKAQRDALTFHQGQGSGDLRYVDAAQRAAWLHYWQQVSPYNGRPNAQRAPSEEEVQRALRVIASWQR
jgi:excisionase family DNA binding protein